MKSNSIEYTSLISIGIVDFALAVLGVIAINNDLKKIGVILITVAILGTVSKIWTMIAGNNLEADIAANKKNMFPGDETEIKVTVSNHGTIPVLWCEGIKPVFEGSSLVPIETPRITLTEMNDEEKSTYRVNEKETGRLLRAGFGAVTAGTAKSTKVKWTAVKRGVTTLQDMKFFTGDGFRLARVEIPKDKSGTRELVVYPKIIPVDSGYFTRIMWEGESSNKGFLEDPSIIKLTRPYQHGDSEKQINWRMVARGQEMTVNQYSTISLKNIHFIFDGPSFGTGQRLEDVLSVLCSLILKISDAGIDVGFSFPQSKGLKAVNIPAIGESMGEILYRMAEYRPLGSDFQLDTLNEVCHMSGRVYLVSKDMVTAEACKINGIKCETLTYDRLKALKGGGGNYTSCAD